MKQVGAVVLIVVAIGAIVAGYWSERRPSVQGKESGGDRRSAVLPAQPEGAPGVQVTIGSHRSIPINELPRGSYKVLAILEGPEQGPAASIYFLVEDAVGGQAWARITRGPEVTRLLSGRKVVAIMAGSSPQGERPGCVSFIFTDRTCVTMEPTN